MTTQYLHSFKFTLASNFLHMHTHSLIPKSKTTDNGQEARLMYMQNHEFHDQRMAGMVSSHNSGQGLCYGYHVGKALHSLIATPKIAYSQL